MAGKSYGAMITKKILLSQLIFSPVCIVIFFATLGYLDDASRSKIWHDIIEKGKKIYMVEWFIWPLAQLINFYFLPTSYRILYDSIVSLGFDVYNSYIAYNVEEEEEEDEEKKESNKNPNKKN